jgi:hypothetical protein
MMDSIKSALENLAKEEGQLKNALLASVLIRGWTSLFEGPIALNSWPVGVNRGVLSVETNSSAWAHQLGLMKGEILTKISKLLGEGKIEDVRFKIGQRKERKIKAAAKPSESAEPITLERLEEKHKEAQRHWKKTGAKTCPTCQMAYFGPDKQCPFCERQKEQEKAREILRIIDQAPWINYSEAKKDAPEMTREEFDRYRRNKKDRVGDLLYKMAWSYLEAGFDKKGKEEFKQTVYDFVMLRAQVKPNEITDKVVEKNLPAKVKLIWQKIKADMTPQT